MNKDFLKGLKITVTDEDLFIRIAEYLQKLHDKTGNVHIDLWKPRTPGKALKTLMEGLGKKLPKAEKRKKAR